MANTFYPTSPMVVQLSSGGNSSTQEFALGTTVSGNDGTEWTYVTASTAITQYDTVGIDESFNAAPITSAIAADGWMVGHAQWAFTSGQYGWVARKGAGSNFKIRTAGLCALDVALYTSATAGVLDDDSTSSQVNIDGLVAVASATATTSSVLAISTWPRSTTF